MADYWAQTGFVVRRQRHGDAGGTRGDQLRAGAGGCKPVAPFDPLRSLPKAGRRVSVAREVVIRSSPSGARGVLRSLSRLSEAGWDLLKPLFEPSLAQSVPEMIYGSLVGEHPPRIAFPACQGGAEFLKIREDGPRFRRPPELAESG